MNRDVNKDGPIYSAAYKLFNMFWLCHVPRNEMMDENHFDYFGIAMSGDRATDEMMATTPEITAISAAEMAQLIKDGVPLSLADPTDAVAIYKLIIEHLRDWRTTLRNVNLISPNIPLEGLSEFNQLAALLVPIARCHGLVEEYDRSYGTDQYPEITSKRSFAIRTKVIPQAKNARHSDAIFEEICQVAANMGYRVKWKPSMVQETYESDNYSAERLYGK